MITRRSMFGLALVPWWPMPAPERRFYCETEHVGILLRRLPDEFDTLWRRGGGWRASECTREEFQRLVPKNLWGLWTAPEFSA